MKSFLARVLTLTVSGAALTASTAAYADETPSSQARVTEHALPMSANEPRIEVVRQRSPGKKAVRFEVEPFVVAHGASAVFELIAIGEEPRVVERCVALASSRECWDGARRIAYGPGDRGMMLRISAAESVAERHVGAVHLAMAR